ncbi:uncharacterized protein MELLADRAFT_84804 [Melampsora larici-populina 98AG31]|uniref:Alpha-type protein kinase domain-containing protein n=1 Tax=Melampsora larici-populina (strain 98AG31 / pathotype 3-4-7) TaxID=747676 RepID=F4SCI1_MELLP|nr:uncharacterized protein MELLADRAFT_84804 [Melampsora larici-populina 98AG31]EGF97646.1 hypothetical protein MELLADRAFT_84804 [Melampsora larici-populina 98AG31]
MEEDTSVMCTLPQCLGCGKCYRFLTNSKCQLCKGSNDAQSGIPTRAPHPNPASTLTNPASASVRNTPLTASTLPQELFQGGDTQPAFKPNYLPVALNSQLQGSIRASQSGRRTVGQPKGKKKKEIEEVIEEETSEIEISMSFLYLSGTGKSNYVRHGLTPRKFKINLDSADWFFSLGWDVYKYYLQEAKDSAFPSKTQQRDNKICALPPDFSSTYCIIVENGVSVTQDSMKTTLISKCKTKKLDKTKFGLLFNMRKYLATLSSDSSPEPDRSRKRTNRYELTSDEEALDESPELDPAPKPYPHTRKRQYPAVSISEPQDQEADRFEEIIHVNSASSAQVQLVQLQQPVPPERDDSADADGPKLECDESMYLEMFGNTHELARSAKEILPYPPRPIANWNEGWLLSLITKNRKAVFKPVAISFRVDRESLIGAGRFMQCYKAELLIALQAHRVVAKQVFGDHCPLAQYQLQAQTYVHVEGVIERFKANVLSNEKFTQLEKDLVNTLRLTRNSLCTS